MPASVPTTMAKRSRTYIWQFTIGLGFLSGLWTAIGIDPEEVVLNLLGTVTGEIFPDPTLRQVFIILPTILLLLSVWAAYKKGKVLGLASVLIAYVAGLSVLVSLWTSVLLLIAAMVTGYLATGRRLI
jgi:small-conductance mechanosensitive channel